MRSLLYLAGRTPSPFPTEPEQLQFPSIVRTELLTPAPDGLIRHDDSSLGEKLLYISEAQAEAMVSPDRIANDRGRKTMAGVKRMAALHGTTLSGSCPS